jgi:NADPH-dependent 7-cyano-7-deazaguanine reductase QueF
MRNMGFLSINYKISGTKIYLPFKAICSVTDKEFSGEIVIEYCPNNKVLEYVDAENVINEYLKEKVTAEELTNEVFLVIQKSIEPKYLKITVDVKHSDAHKPVQVWLES